MLAVGVKVELQSRLTGGSNGSMSLAACWDGTNRVSEASSGGNDVREFRSRVVDHSQVRAASAARKKCGGKKVREDNEAFI